MQSNRKEKPRQTTISGVDVQPLYEDGGEVNLFEQRNEVHRTGDYQHGFCAPLNTSTLNILFTFKEEELKAYTTATRLPKRILDQILRQGQAMIALYKDGANINHAPFLPFYNSAEISTTCLHYNDLAEQLKKIQAATLTYKTKGGCEHQLAFYRYDSDRCYIMDANRLIAIKTPVEASIKVLIDIIKRSNPNSVEMTSVPIKLFPECLSVDSNNSTDNSGTNNESDARETQSKENDNKIAREGAADNLSDTLKTVAAQSFLYSFLSSISKQFVTDFLAEHNYHPEQISLINQAIHSLTLIATGNSLRTAVVQPVINQLLVKCFNMSEKTANDLVTGIVLIETAITAINNPRELKKVAAFMAASIGAGVLGSSLAGFCYGYLKNNFFAGTPSSESQPETTSNNAADKDMENDESWDFEVLGNNKNSLLL